MKKLVAIVVAMVLPFSALGHGEAEWIQKDIGAPRGERYRNFSNENHCCNEHDCKRMTKEEVARYITVTDTEIIVSAPYNVRFEKKKIYGMYFSIDADFWWCRWGKFLGHDENGAEMKTLQCLFIPGEIKS
jgi:hypothetical protein